jgi:hypothetical protein
MYHKFVVSLPFISYKGTAFIFNIQMFAAFCRVNALKLVLQEARKGLNMNNPQ